MTNSEGHERIQVSIPTPNHRRERGRKEVEGEGPTGVPPVRAVDSSEIGMGAMKSGLAWSMCGLLER